MTNLLLAGGAEVFLAVELLESFFLANWARLRMLQSRPEQVQFVEASWLSNKCGNSGADTKNVEEFQPQIEPAITFQLQTAQYVQ